MKLEVHNLKDQHIIQDLVYFTCKHLSVQPKIIEVDTLEEGGLLGMCIDIDEDHFLILVKEHQRKYFTIVHELVHVKQYMKQNLGSLLGAQEYETSWWEQEARSLSKHIMEKFNERHDSERQ